MSKKLKFSFSDVFEISVEYGIDVKKYLNFESSEVFEIKDSDEIDIFDVHPARDQMPNGFAILSYIVTSMFILDFQGVVYELFYGDKAIRNEEISEERAVQFIDKYNLTLTTDDRHGKIWE